MKRHLVTAALVSAFALAACCGKEKEGVAHATTTVGKKYAAIGPKGDTLWQARASQMDIGDSWVAATDVITGRRFVASAGTLVEAFSVTPYTDSIRTEAGGSDYLVTAYNDKGDTLLHARAGEQIEAGGNWLRFVDKKTGLTSYFSAGTVITSVEVADDGKPVATAVGNTDRLVTHITPRGDTAWHLLTESINTDGGYWIVKDKHTGVTKRTSTHFTLIGHDVPRVK